MDTDLFCSFMQRNIPFSWLPPIFIQLFLQRSKNASATFYKRFCNAIHWESSWNKIYNSFKSTQDLFTYMLSVGFYQKFPWKCVWELLSNQAWLPGSVMLAGNWERNTHTPLHHIRHCGSEVSHTGMSASNLWSRSLLHTNTQTPVWQLSQSRPTFTAVNFFRFGWMLTLCSRTLTNTPHVPVREATIRFFTVSWHTSWSTSPKFWACQL